MIYIVESDSNSIQKKMIDKIIKFNNISNEHIRVFDYEEKNDLSSAFFNYFSINFDKSKKAIILKNSNFLNNIKTNKEIEDKFEESLINKFENILILTIDKWNKTGKIHKKFATKLQVYKKLSPKNLELKKFIINFFKSKGYDVEPDVEINIINKLGENNFDLLISELKKIELLSKDIITNKLIDSCIIDFNKQKIYKISEYFLRKDINGLKKIINELKSEGESSFLICDVLIKEISKFLRYKILIENNFNESKIQKMTNWNIWSVKKYSQYLKYWDNMNDINALLNDVLIKNMFINIIENNPNKPIDLIEKILVNNILKYI